MEFPKESANNNARIHDYRIPNNRKNSGQCVNYTVDGEKLIMDRLALMYGVFEI